MPDVAAAVIPPAMEKKERMSPGFLKNDPAIPSGHVTICFLGNPDFDTRTTNMAASLRSRKYRVRMIGFDWLTEPFRTVRKKDGCTFRLRKGRFSLLFYLRFAFLMLSELRKHKPDIIVASDFYSLPLCLAAAGFHGSRLIYDARDIVSELTAVRNKKRVKPLIQWIEKFCIIRADHVLVCGDMDAGYFRDKYGIGMPCLLRNFPVSQTIGEPVDYRNLFGIPETRTVLLYQGVIVRGRGVEPVFQLLQSAAMFDFVLLGGGEDMRYYQNLAAEMGIADRVHFAGKIPQKDLMKYTAGADIGVCLIEDVSLNNQYALPNKLFEYIMAGIPVIASGLPQIKQVVERYHVGVVAADLSAAFLKRILDVWRRDPALLKRFSQHCLQAAEELNWEHDFAGIEWLFRPSGEL